MTFKMKNPWVGVAGIGVELMCVAAVALEAPAPVWVLALLLGALLIVLAFALGEPAEQAGAPSASGGSGEGYVRGNVFGDNTNISISERVSAPRTANKVLVTATVADLIGIYRDNTEIQAERLAETYIGGWLKVEGVVGDVSAQGGDFRVSIDAAGELVAAYFVESVHEHLPRLRRADPIHLIGRISRITGLAVTVEESEFVL